MLLMATGKDMKNLVIRSGWFHFRGYVPLDLRRSGHAAERTQSLDTTDYGEAVRRRNKARVEFDEWVAQERARRDGRYTVLTSLTIEQEIALALEVYRHLYPLVERARERLALRTSKERSEALEAEQWMLENTKESASVGDDFFGEFGRYTDWVLKDRMIRIDNPRAKERLTTRVGEAIVQIKQDQVNRIRGEASVSLDTRFVDPITLGPRPPSSVLPGGPNAPTAEYRLIDQLKVFSESLADSRGLKGRSSVKYTNRLLVEFFGPDMDVRTLRRQQVVDFRGLLTKVPVNSTKKYPGIPITTVVAKRNPAHPVLSIESVNKNLGNVVQFVRWMHKLEIITNLPSLDGISLANPVRENKRRQAFSTEQLRIIFESRLMRDAAASNSINFWAFVIGLYHGLRLNEIATLEPSDILQYGGVAMFQIRFPKALLDGTRRGRTKVVPRKFPMHPILVKLKLPEHAASRMGAELLFDDVVEGTDGYLSDAVSDWMRIMLDSVGIAKGGPTFHSNRHNFRDATRSAKMQETMVDFLGGWKPVGIKNRHYLSDPGQADVLKELQHVTYGGIDKLILELKVS